MLARAQVEHLVLIGNPASGTTPLLRLFQQLERDVRTSIELTTDLSPLAACDLIVTATTAGRPLLDGAQLRAGTIVCDVARPPDTAARLRARGDLTVIEGGRVALPDPAIRFGAGNLQNLPDGITLACLAETIVLALEGDPRDSGIGDNAALAEVDRVMALAARHGFTLAGAAAEPIEIARPQPAPGVLGREPEFSLAHTA
jgi:predicted amino acid dehydrogenase